LDDGFGTAAGAILGNALGRAAIATSSQLYDASMSWLQVPSICTFFPAPSMHQK